MPDRVLVKAVMERLIGQVSLSQQTLEKVLYTLSQMGLLANADQQTDSDHEPAWTMRFQVCEINPNRMALAGSNLLLRFPLAVELSGTSRQTKVVSC